MSVFPRLTLVHDWLTGMRRGKVPRGPLPPLPDARLFTLLHSRGSVASSIERLGPHLVPPAAAEALRNTIDIYCP
jgi:hypothetical protein